MIKIVTALGNPQINELLRKEKELEIIAPDIQYQEGIFEILNENKNIEKILISELLPGENTLQEIIKKIKEKNNKIEIIIFLEKENKYLENEIKNLGIKKIIYNNQMSIKEIIKLLIQNEENIEELKREIQNLKKILEQNNIQSQNKKQEIEEEKNINNKNYIISILGTGGVGKSIVTIQLANILKIKNKKILIIDFDILNNSLHTMLGVQKYTKKVQKILKENDIISSQIQIKDLIIKINSSIDLISGINLMFDSKYKISSEKIYSIIQEIKKYYDYILIDTSSECFFDYTKNIIENSNINIFITEANLSEIKKSKNLLNIYINKWNINKNKINILFNKYNKNSIDINILKNIFSEFNILGKLNFDEKYNLIINKNGITCDNKIMKEYININKKIEEGNLTKINS